MGVRSQHGAVVVFGGGFLGRRLARSLERAILVSSVDIADDRAVTACLREHRPDAVVNAAAKNGRPNVDWCEDHKVETARSNTVGAITVGLACRDAGIRLVHLSSGCVFDGPSPSPGGWREDDPANPQSFYAASKYAADLVLSKMEDTAVVRLRMPIDGEPGPRNLVTKLAGYAEVIDVENSVTVVDDLVDVVAALARHSASGVFHATNPGVLRHRELMTLYRSVVDPSHRCELVPEHVLYERGRVRARRSNCVLADTRLTALGIRMRPLSDALPGLLRAYARSTSTATANEGSVEC